jgi:peptidyl-tRNA hydrolase, PTH1 family
LAPAGAASPPTPPAQTSPVRLVVGLGNPEPRYARTRHNAGQAVVERLAERLGAPRMRQKFAGRFAEARGPAGPLGLLVPTTYMNASGESVGPAAGALRARPGQVLVVHDELDLPFGTVRGKRGGGTAGHNGLRSLRDGLGSPDFLRVRIGIGHPPADFRGDGADWVLRPFSEPPEEVEAMLVQALEMVEAVLADGMEAALSRFHAGEPGARARARRERRTALDPTEGAAADGAEAP